MQRHMLKELHTKSEAETFDAAEKLAAMLRPGQVICLYGELGVGKTVFAKGLCKALGVTDYVNSPTFTLVNEYEGTSGPVYHFDLYRIEEPEELYEIGFDEYISRGTAVIIEWPEQGGNLLPPKRLEVKLTREGEDGRRITIEEFEA